MKWKKKTEADRKRERGRWRERGKKKSKHGLEIRFASKIDEGLSLKC